MKNYVFAALLLALAGTCAAQPQPGSTLLAPAQLDQLLSPVALYPDPLLGALLPAATHPDQIASAAGLLSAGNDASVVAQQPFDDSVKALAQFPNVLTWMAQNPDWTLALGNAVATEQPQVFDAVQRLRANAEASGVLVSSPQQQVVDANGVISIVPAQPNVVYVPAYNPQVLESPSAYGTAPETFVMSYSIGLAPTFDPDWRGHAVWIDRTHNNRWDNDRSRVARDSSRVQWRPSRGITVPRSSTAPRPAYVPRPSRFSEHAPVTRTPGLSPTGRIDTPSGRPVWNERGTRNNEGRGRSAETHNGPPPRRPDINPGYSGDGSRNGDGRDGDRHDDR